MNDINDMDNRKRWLQPGEIVPILRWFPTYRRANWRYDLLAGLTLAAFVLPESMAYATLAGMPAYTGIYCCLAGGLLFALFTSSGQVAVGPTSSISLMIGSTFAGMSIASPGHWVAMAGLTALVVALLCLIAYLLKLSSLVNFISNSILLGFKAGAALSIMSTQFPKILGIEAGGKHFFSRIAHILTHLGDSKPTVLLLSAGAFLLLFLGDRIRKGFPTALLLVAGAILLVANTRLGQAGLHLTGPIPAGLPPLKLPSLDLIEADIILPLAIACFLVGYIETISAARTFALKHGTVINPRQELMAMSMANAATAFTGGYVVSGGLSQSTVNDHSGARSPMSLIISSVILALLLFFFSDALQHLPEFILAVIVIHAVSSLISLRALRELRQLSSLEFTVALIALVAVLVFGILKGVMLAAIMSLVLLIRRTSQAYVAELGRIGDTKHFSDIERHPENHRVKDLLILRIESPVLYFNAENIEQSIREKMGLMPGIRGLVLDLSASPYVDLTGADMFLQLGKSLQASGVQIRLASTLAQARVILRKKGMEALSGHISRSMGIPEAIADIHQSTAWTPR